MKIRETSPIGLFILLSISVHALVFSLIDCLKPFEFTRPVMVVVVELVEMGGVKERFSSSGTVCSKSDLPGGMRKKVEVLTTGNAVHEQENLRVYEKSSAPQPAKPSQQEHDENKEAIDTVDKIETVSSNEAKVKNVIGSDKVLPASEEGLPPIPKRNADEIVNVKREKLTYRIIMYGIPVGSAVLEAVHDGDEVRISSTVSSNTVISTVYPVSDHAETRFIEGRYIISRIRQREGSFTSDTGFTISLAEKNIFWIDRLHNRFSNNPLPRADVLDVLTGFYYLRNQQLEVGKPVVLHLFDSNRYAATTVQVLRKEHVSLSGFREAEAIVVQPLIETDCIFRRAGDMLIWLSDDGNRVPVRLVTAVPLGRVRAELVSAEVERN